MLESKNYNRRTRKVGSKRESRINPLVAGVRSRETSERAEVIKKVFAPSGNQDKREWRTVRAYGTQKHRWEKTI